VPQQLPVVGVVNKPVPQPDGGFLPQRPQPDVEVVTVNSPVSPAPVATLVPASPVVQNQNPLVNSNNNVEAQIDHVVANLYRPVSVVNTRFNNNGNTAAAQEYIII